MNSSFDGLFKCHAVFPRQTAVRREALPRKEELLKVYKKIVRSSGLVSALSNFHSYSCDVTFFMGLKIHIYFLVNTLLSHFSRLSSLHCPYKVALHSVLQLQATVLLMGVLDKLHVILYSILRCFFSKLSYFLKSK